MPVLLHGPTDSDRPDHRIALRVKLLEYWRSSVKKTLGRNKNEIYLSPLLWFFALFLNSLALEQGLFFVLAAIGLNLLALICTINALRDWRQMNWLEQIGSVVWGTLLLLWIVMVLLGSFFDG